MLFNLSTGTEINNDVFDFDIKERSVSLMYVDTKYLQDYANTLCNIRDSIQRKPLEWKTLDNSLPVSSSLYMNLKDGDKIIQIGESTLSDLTDDMKEFIKNFIVIRLDEIKDVFSPFCGIVDDKDNINTIAHNLSMYVTAIGFPNCDINIKKNIFCINGKTYKDANDMINDPDNIGLIIETFMKTYSDEHLIFVIDNKTDKEISDILKTNQDYFRNRFIGIILGIDTDK